MQYHSIVFPKPCMDCRYNALCTRRNYCDSLEMCTRKCLEAGLCPVWRTDGICLYKCSKNLVYQLCGSSCKETDIILNKLDNSKCASGPVKECFCSENYVFHNDSSILRHTYILTS
ncbi:unnamed protein product [Lasius platythorax]|uniref:TIL domain-containing protein n=1 Tax=Lasius platythorax TaxID=488582 RepID=A0AAV2NDT4_9HYME